MYLDGVMSGWKWSSFPRFNFPSDASYYPADYSNQHEPENNFHQATLAQQSDTVGSEQPFATVANWSFTELRPNSARLPRSE